MNVIFLDIDGVLNCKETKDCFEGYIGLDKDKIELFEDIVRKTDSYWVLSSTWRLDKAHVSYLFRNLSDDILDRYKGKTPNLNTIIRGEEIQRWLDIGMPIDFIILDDVDNMAHLSNKLIKTSYDTGLTREIADRAISILNGHGDTKPQLTGEL